MARDIDPAAELHHFLLAQNTRTWPPLRIESSTSRCMVIGPVIVGCASSMATFALTRLRKESCTSQMTPSSYYARKAAHPRSQTDTLHDHLVRAAEVLIPQQRLGRNQVLCANSLLRAIIVAQTTPKQNGKQKRCARTTNSVSVRTIIKCPNLKRAAGKCHRQIKLPSRRVSGILCPTRKLPFGISWPEKKCTATELEHFLPETRRKHQVLVSRQLPLCAPHHCQQRTSDATFTTPRRSVSDTPFFANRTTICQI